MSMFAQEISPVTFVPQDLCTTRLDQFSANVRQLIEDCGLRVGGWPSHLAVGPTSVAEFKAAKHAFMLLSDSVSNREVNGREILVFRLRESLPLLGNRVSYVEVPFPKEPIAQSGGSRAQLRWERAEFVIPGGVFDLEDLHTWTEQRYSELLKAPPAGVEVSVKMPTAGADQPPDPQLSLKRIGSGPIIRLHPMPIGMLREDSLTGITSCSSINALIDSYGGSSIEVCARHPTEGHLRIARAAGDRIAFIVQREGNTIMDINFDGTAPENMSDYTVHDVIRFVSDHAIDLSARRSTVMPDLRTTDITGAAQRPSR